MRTLILSCLGAIAICLVVLPSVWRVAYEQGYWERGAIACESNTTEPKGRK